MPLCLEFFSFFLWFLTKTTHEQALPCHFDGKVWPHNTRFVKDFFLFLYFGIPCLPRWKFKIVIHSPSRCRELSSLAAIDEAKPTIPNKNPLAVIEDETLRHKLKVSAMIRGRCHHISNGECHHIDCLERESL